MSTRTSCNNSVAILEMTGQGDRLCQRGGAFSPRRPLAVAAETRIPAANRLIRRPPAPRLDDRISSVDWHELSPVRPRHTAVSDSLPELFVPARELAGHGRVLWAR